MRLLRVLAGAGVGADLVVCVVVGAVLGGAIVLSRLGVLGLLRLFLLLAPC